MIQKEKLQKWVLASLIIAATLGFAAPAFTQGDIVAFEEGAIMEINHFSGYMFLNEKKIYLDRNTVVMNQKEEVQEVRVLKPGMLVAAFLEMKANQLRAVRINVFPSKP
ncbi:MAG TPA: hypothetical protein VGB26_12965 [Nitrospiria bacterium]|jgi:hypothetical protein